jgi:hypothetical protein
VADALTRPTPGADPREVLDRVVRLTSRLIATAPGFAAVQRTLSFTLSARRVVDRALEAAWSAANVPTYGDVERLEAELSRARAAIVALESQIRELAEAQDRDG